MDSFFEEFSDYNVSTGFNTDQCWTLNVACKQQLLKELDRHLEEPTMLDDHTILYVHNREYAGE